MIPFLSVKSQAIKLKVKPQFPAQLIGGTGIGVIKASGIYTVNLDINELQVLTSLVNPSASYFVVYDATAQTFGKMSFFFNHTATTEIYTVAQLPTAVGNRGLRRFVTDATVTTFASVVAGGGANAVPVYSDNAAWRIG